LQKRYLFLGVVIMYRYALLGLFLSFVPPVFAHHGGASTSQGPGTPIETNTPLTVPKGQTIVYGRFEIADFRKFAHADPYNIDSFRFYQLGASHGLTDYLTVTAILPFNAKSQDNHGTLRGIGDAKVLFTLGLNYDSENGLDFNGFDDTAVELGESDKTYFGLVAGFSAPTGRSDIDLGLGVEGGLQPGFGSYTATVGLTAMKPLSDRFTLAGDISTDIFTPNEFDDKFGNEFRANLAGVYELYADQEATFKRLDGIVELNYLRLTRDQTAGVSELGTGGQILYLGPGFRAQIGDYNVGTLIKFPIATGLNEKDMQQGAEGLENYRFVFTLSRGF
jgi:hypothetical protein